MGLTVRGLAGRGRVVVATVVAACAVFLAMTIGGRGCGGGTDSPEGAVRAFIEATAAGDRDAVWTLLGPATRARLAEAARTATAKVGGGRRFRPIEMLEVGASAATYEPTDVIVRDVSGDRAVVDVLGPAGRRDQVRTVRIDGEWRVELEFPPAEQALDDR